MRRSPGKPTARLVRLALLVALMSFWGIRASYAQAVELDTRVLFFHEPAKGSTMTVYTPSADLTARPWDSLSVSAGWEADIVSGASEKVKAGPLARNPDITSGASVKDTRHM